MSNSRIVQLAQLIASKTAVINKHIHDNNLPQPSFEIEGPTEAIQQATPEIERARDDVVEASIELRQLLEGPVKLLLPECNFSPLAAVHHFRIASHLPMNLSISFAELAEKCNLLEHDLRRIVRFTAVHHRVFCEPKEGFVAHTAASKILAEIAMIDHLMGLTFEECWPAHARVNDAIAKKSQEANVSGYALANNTSLTTFEFLDQNPARAQRFASAMSSTSAASLEALSSYFDWASLPADSTVVDIGGSQGHVSIHLARKFPHLQFVVQDLPAVVDGAEAKLPDDVAGRVKIRPHDMFKIQPVKQADVYLLRYVLHDWSDKYCVEILRRIIPSLKEGAQIVIQDHLLPVPGSMSLLQEMQLRSMDAIMLSLFNSRERGEADWREVFAATDSSFKSIRATRIKEIPSTGIIVAEWS